MSTEVQTKPSVQLSAEKAHINFHAFLTLRLSSAVCYVELCVQPGRTWSLHVVKTLRHIMPEKSDIMRWRVMTQYKEEVWLRWPLNVACHARLQSSVLKKLFPLNLSMLDKWLTPALLALLPSFKYTGFCSCHISLLTLFVTMRQDT